MLSAIPDPRALKRLISVQEICGKFQPETALHMPSSACADNKSKTLLAVTKYEVTDGRSDAVIGMLKKAIPSPRDRQPEPSLSLFHNEVRMTQQTMLLVRQWPVHEGKHQFHWSHTCSGSRDFEGQV